MNTNPAYVTFISNITAGAAAIGLTTSTRENQNWVFIRVDAGDAELILPKSATTMVGKRADSHVDLKGINGCEPLTKPNGKVICHLRIESEAQVLEALKRFSGQTKRATLSPTPRRLTVASQPASQAPVKDSYQYTAEEEAAIAAELLA